MMLVKFIFHVWLIKLSRQTHKRTSCLLRTCMAAA